MPSMAATIDGRAARTAAGTVASLSFMTAATSAVDISSIRAKRAAARLGAEVVEGGGGRRPSRVHHLLRASDEAPAEERPAAAQAVHGVAGERSH